METRTKTGSIANRPTGFHAGHYYDAGGVGGRIGFLGISGSGKTFRMGRVARNCSRAVVFNTVAAYGSGARQNPLPGYGLVATPAELVQYIGARWKSGPLRVIYQPLSGNVEKHFEDVTRLVWEMRDVMLFVDEVWRFQGPAWSPPAFSNMILMGRARGVGIGWTSQRPQPVDKALVRQSTELYIGRVISEADIRKIQEEFPLNDEAAAAIRAVGQWEFVHAYNDGTWRLEGR